MFLFYRQREQQGVGTLEDILQVKDGQATLKANCVPGSAHQMRDEQAFFGGTASVEKLSSAAFDIILKRYDNPSEQSVH
jgi:hypothetical protein